MIKRPFLFSIFFAGFLFLLYGVDKIFYLLYNLDLAGFALRRDLYAGESMIAFLNSFVSVDLFIKVFQYFLMVPWAFLFASLVTKAAIFFIVFKISNSLMQDEKKAIFATVIYLLSTEGSTHGLIFNGMFGSPIFFKASFSIIFTLAGMYSTIKSRYYIAAIFFIVSILAHPLDGLCAFVFFVSGYAAFLLFKQRLDIKKAVFPALLIFSGMLVMVLFAHRAVAQYLPGAASTPLKYWYRHCMSIEPDDFSMLWTLGAFGFGLVPLLIISSYILFRQKGKTMLHFLYAGSFIFLCGCVGVELLHSGGVFFGAFSEYFMVLEFRRGVWVTMLFAFLIIFKQIYEQRSADCVARQGNCLLSILFICTYICPNPFKIMLLAMLFLIFGFSMNRLILAGSIGGMILIHMMGDYPYPLSRQEMLRGVLAFIGYIIFYLLVRRLSKKRFDMLLVSFILFSLLPTFSRAVTKMVFFSDVKLIANRGLFQAPEHTRLILDVYKDRGKVIDVQLIESVRKYNVAKKTVLYPLAEATYSDRILLAGPEFIGMYDFSCSILNRRYYPYLFGKINDLVAARDRNKPPFMNYKNKDDLINQIDKMYASLSLSQLAVLKQKYNLGILVTPSFYNSLGLIYSNERYRVYDLSNL